MVMAWIAKVDGPGPDARLQYYLELSKLGDTWLNCKEGGLCVDNCKKKEYMAWMSCNCKSIPHPPGGRPRLVIPNGVPANWAYQNGKLPGMGACHFNVFVPLFASLTPRYWLKSPPPMSTSMLAKDVCHEDDKYGEWCQSLAPWPHHHGQGILTIHIMHGQGHHMNGQGWITSCMARELVEQLWQLLAS